MKKRFISIIALAVALLVVLTACGQSRQDQTQGSAPPPSTSKDAEKDESAVENEDFLKKFTEANKKLQSVRLSLRAEYLSDGEVSSISGEGLYEYDPETRERVAYHAAQLVQKADQKGTSEVVYQKPGPAFSRANGMSWEQSGFEQDQIDYDGFADILQKILLEEKVELKEATGGNYEIFLNDKNFDLIGTFRGELNFSLENADQKDADKEVLFRVDKETFFIKEVSVSMKYDNPNGKKFNNDTKITFSDHNKIEKDAISKVFSEAKK